jgi:hypothetical protein
LTPLLKILSALILILSTIALAWEPAQNLEYEYALVTSWALVFGLPLIGCLWPTKATGRRPSIPRLPLFRASGRQFLLLLSLPAVAFLPGLLLFMTNQCACSGRGFSLWMSLLVVPAGWLGTAGFIYAASPEPRRFSKWWVVVGPWLGAFFGAALLWFFPQKRVVNIFLGFLHGPIYDLWIPLDAGVLWARVSHGILGIILLGLAVRYIKTPGRRRRGVQAQRLFPVLLSLFFCGQLLSFFYDSARHGVWFLNRAMPDVIQEPNIELHYRRTSPHDEDLAKDLARDAAFHVSEILSTMGAKVDRPIRVYAYTSADKKKLLFGGGNTDVTDVWTPSIHIELGPSPHPTLRHELVHGVASFVSWHGIGFHPNMLITEGLAMALAPTADSLGFDEIAASMLKSGRIGSLESLMSPFGFWSVSGQRSYVVAGSLLRWLISKYGTNAVREIYSGGTIESVAGVEESKILAMWSQDVSRQHSDSNELVIEHFSRDPGVFAARCAHTSEDLAQDASSDVWTRLRQPAGWKPASWSLWRLGLMPSDRDAGLTRLRADVAEVMKRPAPDPATLRGWIQTIEKAHAWPPKVMEDVELAILQSDVESVTGLKEASTGILLKLMDSFSSRSPGTTIRRQVEVRFELDKMKSQAAAADWRKYVAGWGPLPEASNHDDWIQSYLASRRVAHPTKERLDAWRVLVPKSEVYPDVQREWTRSLASSYAELHAWSQARDLYLDLTDLSSGEAKLLAAEHVRRMDHFVSAKTPK